MESADSGSSSSEEKFLNCLIAKEKGNLTVLPKSGVLEAVDVILQTKTAGKKTKLKESARVCRSLCMDRTHLPFHESLLTFRKNRNNMLPILSEMRHCLLTGDWDSYKELLLMMFKCPKISTGFILYCVRSCFILLFNHPNRTAELMDNFIEGCLCINEESRKIQYLQDCFTLRGSLACTSSENIDNESNNEEEEEMIFNSDYSSD